MLDDSPEKFKHVALRNVILIPEFTVLDPQIDCQKDDELLKMSEYLSNLCQSEVSDVRWYLERFPYRSQSAQTGSSSRNGRT